MGIARFRVLDAHRVRARLPIPVTDTGQKHDDSVMLLIVDVSIEPFDGNPTHSGRSILRGQLDF